MTCPRVILLLKSVLILQGIFFRAHAQDSIYNKYHLQTVDSAEYAQQVKVSSHLELVDVSRYVPSAVIDIRYATADNFMHRPMYTEAAAYLRKAAADSLRVIQQELNRLGYGLKIYDAYRPYHVTVSFYEQFRDTTYVASPYTGSRHNRGCAVDVTLIALKSGNELEMPTGYDDFTTKAHALSRRVSSRAVRNRKILQQIMTKHGFNIYKAEWWHFDFKGWNSYPVMNVSFAQLKKEQAR